MSKSEAKGAAGELDGVFWEIEVWVTVGEGISHTLEQKKGSPYWAPSLDSNYKPTSNVSTDPE